MNRTQLEQHLDELGIRRDAYCLEGGLPNECYTLASRETGWAVYYSERERRSAERQFSSEAEACRFLIEWILESRISRMTPDQIAAANAVTRARQATHRSRP